MAASNSRATTPIPLSTPTITATTWLTLFAISIYFYYRHSFDTPSSLSLYNSLFLVFIFVSIATLLVIAVRATVVAWITILVLLAFAGKRRHSLVRESRDITTYLTMYLFNALLKERVLIAIVFIGVSFVVHLLRGDQSKKNPALDVDVDVVGISVINLYIPDEHVQ